MVNSNQIENERLFRIVSQIDEACRALVDLSSKQEMVGSEHLPNIRSSCSACLSSRSLPDTRRLGDLLREIHGPVTGGENPQRNIFNTPVPVTGISTSIPLDQIRADFDETLIEIERNLG